MNKYFMNKRLLSVLVVILLLMVVPAMGAVKKTKAATPEATVKVKAKVVTTEAIAKAPTQEAAAKKIIKFKDLAAKHPAYPYVMKMVVSYEAIAGYPDGTFRGDKTVSRAEFSKVLMNTLSYLEKKYQITLADEPASKEAKFKDLKATHWAYPNIIDLVAKYKIITGYPNGTYGPNKTISRFELATILAKTMKLVYARYEMPLPTPEAAAFKDVKKNHWAMRDIQLLLHFKVMGAEKGKGKSAVFSGLKDVSRFDVATAGAKLIARIDSEIGKLPESKIKALRQKYGVKMAPAPAPVSRVERSVQVSSRPEGYITSGWGNIYEAGSGTNNSLGFYASASYGNIFRLWKLSGNYELTGKYGYNQVVYIVPSGGGVRGGTNNENRYEVELNTIYPIVKFMGVTGKLLLGAKYINLNNPTAPTNFTGFNAGVVTAARLFSRNFLLRAFYSLPLARAQVSPSILGQPSQLFDYEASIDAEMFKIPLLMGFAGETMTLTGGGLRNYNMAFARFFLF
jgi:hypothetical protein